MVAARKAALEVIWRHAMPVFQLTPIDAAACPIVIVEFGMWNNFEFGPTGQGSAFELWAEHQEERDELLANCLRAVMEGRFEIALRGGRVLGRPKDAWTLVGRFLDLPGGTLRYEKTPVRAEEFQFVFGDSLPAPGEDAGPHRFDAY